MQKQKFDEIVSYFNKKVSEMEIETKYKMELLGMVTALGCAHEKETHDKRTETHACDCISRQAAIEHLKKRLYETEFNSTAEYPYYQEIADNRVDVWMNEVPVAEPVRKTGRWIIEPGIGCKCSVCDFDIGNDLDFMEYVNFCPNCGAYMKGETDD